MTEIYRCDICQDEFRTKQSCLKHEKTHYKNLSTEQIIKLQCKNKKETPCKYCSHIYYTYNCEEKCEIKDKSIVCNSSNEYKFLELNEFQKLYFEKEKE